MDYDKLDFTSLMRGFNNGYVNRDLQGNVKYSSKPFVYYETDNLEVGNRGKYDYRVPKLKQEFKLLNPFDDIRTAVSIIPSIDPDSPAGTVSAAVYSNTGNHADIRNRSLVQSISFNNLSPKQALVLIENIKKNPELADLMESEAFYNKAREVEIKPDLVKKVLDKWFDPSGLDLKPGTPIRLFDGPAYKEVQQQRLATLDKLKALLKARNLRNLGLMVAGAGASGAAGSLFDDKDRMLSSGLSTAAGAAALPTGLATLGGKKLNRLITRKPLVGLAAGTLGGIGGFLGNNTIQDFLQKIR